MNLVIANQVASYLHIMLMILVVFEVVIAAYVLNFYVFDFLQEREYRLR